MEKSVGDEFVLLMTALNGSTSVSLTTLNLQALVPLAYAVPSFVLYVIIIVIILRKFAEPFYRLFAVNGVLVRLLYLD